MALLLYEVRQVGLSEFAYLLCCSLFAGILFRVYFTQDQVLAGRFFKTRVLWGPGDKDALVELVTHAMSRAPGTYQPDETVEPQAPGLS